ncbi:MAG TPA: hypothetical protein VN671_07565 [Solirubrobacterales bacterium]|nr:hypothetical protein [Solirubrobacterales bacterium]
MSYSPHAFRRPFVASLAIALVLLGGSFGVAKSASAAAPGHPTAAVERVVGPTPERLAHADVPSIRHHFAELEVDSGDVRSAIETANLANAKPGQGGATVSSWRRATTGDSVRS